MFLLYLPSIAPSPDDARQALEDELAKPGYFDLGALLRSFLGTTPKPAQSGNHRATLSGLGTPHNYYPDCSDNRVLHYSATTQESIKRHPS